MGNCPVSVIIPTYNRKELVFRALESVLNQNLSCDEIIIVDDGSTDNTAEMVREIIEGGESKVTLLQQQNKGPAAARNHGIESSRNEVIAFLDSDDHWKRKKLALQYQAFAKNPEYLISHTKEKWLRRGKHLNQKKKHIPRHGEIFDHCLQLCAVGMSTVMVRKKLFEKIGYFDENLPCCEDYDLWLRTSINHEFLLVDEPLTIKEGGRDDQVSYQFRVGMDEFRINSILKILDRGELGDRLTAMALQELEKKISIFSLGCIKHGKKEKGLHYQNLLQQYLEKVESK